MFILMKCKYLMKQKSTHATYLTWRTWWVFLLNPGIFRIHPRPFNFLWDFVPRKKDLRTSSFYSNSSNFQPAFLTIFLSFTIQLRRFPQRYLDLWCFMDRSHGVSSPWFTTTIWENMFAWLFPFASWPSTSKKIHRKWIFRHRSVRLEICMSWSVVFLGTPNNGTPFMVSGTHTIPIRIPKDI